MSKSYYVALNTCVSKLLNVCIEVIQVIQAEPTTKVFVT